MSLGRTAQRLGLAAATALAAAVLAPGTAEAGGPVLVTGKGIAGGALLGGEVVIIPMGAAGVSRGWPYFVFGGLGMVGGAIGGYFVEKKTAVDSTTGAGGPAEPALYMLAGGLALIIPAVIVSLNATAYKPPDSDRSEPANNEPAKEPPKAVPGAPPAPIPGEGPAPGATSQRVFKYRSTYRAELASMPHIPTALLDMYQGKTCFGLPAIQVRPLYTQAETVKYGVAQGTEMRIPVFKAMF